MEEVSNGLPPTNSEWNDNAWRRRSFSTKLDTMLYTLRQACSLASCGATPIMLRNDRKGTVPSLT